MDNQHKLIKGYRDLTQAEIDLMNEGKQLEKQVLTYLEKLNKAEFATDENQMPDRRWLAVGRTDIEKGFMSVIRSIAKPNT